MKGVFYNSTPAACSIYETGKMCYNALKTSTKYALEYTEATTFDCKAPVDFAIFNHHVTTCNWMCKETFNGYKGKLFCIVTEVTFAAGNPIGLSPNYFHHYIVLDPTIPETAKIHAFPRPLQSFAVATEFKDPGYPVIGSFGFPHGGKDWHLIVEAVQKEYDTALIKFHIPVATYLTLPLSLSLIEEIKAKCKAVLRKPGVKLEITSTYMNDVELVRWCGQNTINCFFYCREHVSRAGLSATVDQALASKRPLLTTQDRTFRHVLTKLKPYPKTSIAEAIATTKPIVEDICRAWSTPNFVAKFESLLLCLFLFVLMFKKKQTTCILKI